jgi:hypothetical protein
MVHWWYNHSQKNTQNDMSHVMSKCVIWRGAIFIYGVAGLSCVFAEEKVMNEQLKSSGYVTIVVIVPESHADLIRTVMAQVGAGESEHYSHGSFSIKGTSRFMPKKGSRPFLGQEGVLETVVEERIETICSLERLETVVQAIKNAHPYEETVIDIYSIYEIGYKRAVK